MAAMAAATASTSNAQAGKSGQKGSNYPLDSHNKLSSAGAAANLKYANPRDLPSFPSVGLTDTGSSAGAAASLASASKKSFEHWQPDPSASASAAAVLAKDAKGPEPWKPDQSNAGSKAAILAAKEGGHVNIWQPGKSEYGNSAATQALKASSTLSPKIDYGYTEEGHRRSLMAATGAMRSSRKRADSTPIPVGQYSDSEHSNANALSAATMANKPSTNAKSGAPRSSGLNGEQIYIVSKNNAARDLYTSHPTIGPGAEEKNRADVLQAAAMSMAKQMYDIQQKHIDEAAAAGKPSDSVSAATAVHGRHPSVSTIGEPPYNQYSNLEEAAKKLAAERLAKLHDEHASYRQYYGTTSPQKHMSMRGRMRRRASSDGATMDDQEQSRKIRSQMGLFNDKLAEVDEKKRKQDRAALMAAAQKNVRASMHGLDEKVFADTGRIAPSMLEAYEAKARAAAEEKSKSRMTNYGKVDIGGGKFLEQADVDAVASARVQPVLDEINQRAATQLAREEEIRLDEEERKRQVQMDKEREAELKKDDKLAKEKAKADEKTKKNEEKQKAKEEKQRAKEISAAEAAKKAEENKEKLTKSIGLVVGTDSAPAPKTVDSPKTVEEVPAATSPKGDSKVKSWFKDKLQSRRLSKPQKPEATDATTPEVSGGLTTVITGNASNPSINLGNDSEREVAMAGKLGHGDTNPHEDLAHERSVSPYISVSPAKAAEGDRGRPGYSRKASSRDEDDLYEARDTVDSDLAPPPKVGAADRHSPSPVRDSKFHEVL